MIHDPLTPVEELLARGGVVVLSGAGVSTASGIPDYRGPTGRNRTSAPMQWADFRDSPAHRQRYWARALIGFRRFGSVAPNAAHDAVATLEEQDVVTSVVTQNVDGLHQQAGSRAVVELHGTLSQVICLSCGMVRDRHDLQQALDAANPWLDEVVAPLQADGDAVLDDALVDEVRMVRCVCGGEYRPDVVFFGEHVPVTRMQAARAAVEQARAVLVLGSSLQVGSGYLLVRRALQSGAAVAIINQGPTRADHLVELRVDQDVTTVLPELLRRRGC